MRKLLVVLSLATLLCILCACPAKLAGPSGAVDNFYSAMKANDYNAAAGYVAMKDPKADPKQLTALLTIMGASMSGTHKGIDHWDISNEKITNDKATVHVKMTYKDGTNDESNVDLVLRDGQWKLDMGK